MRISKLRLSIVLLGAVSSLTFAHSPAFGSAPADANAVVAFVDTGINPYHRTFRDDSARAYQHPSTYIPGYPKSAIALPISLGEKNYWAAVKKDCERIWSKVEPGKLYWFPGTKIVGAISFLAPGKVNCLPKKPTGAVVLDYGGHGTMTASRGTSVEYGACKECLTVSVQFPTSIPIFSPSSSTQPAVDAIKWAAANADWIDAQSNSWGPFVPLWEPTGQAGLVTSNPTLVRAVEEVSRRHFAFWASGNGAAFRFGVLGHPTFLAPHMSPSAIIVGGHDSGYVNTWPGFPAHVVSDSCASWAAFHDHTSKSAENVGGGTSGATPFVAGGAARILLEARRILGDTSTGVTKGIVAEGPKGLVSKGPLADGSFTVDEWREVLFKTASSRPKAAQHEDGPPCPLDANTGPYAPTPVKWEDVPEGYPEYLHIGYGAVDAQSWALAAKVLAGGSPLPDRSDTDAYFERDRQIREASYQIFSGPYVEGVGL